ncbi:MAG: hypothetical protein ACOC8H_02220 [bacterium]
MIRLDCFWDFIWCRPGLSASADEWRRCLGDDGWRLFRKRLFVGDGTAHAFTRADGRTLQVVPMSRGGYGLVCCATGNIEKAGMAETDVRAYRLRAAAIRSLVAEALGLTSDPHPVRNAPTAFSIGSWSPVTGAEIAVFMMLPPTTNLLVKEIGRLLLENDRGFVLLVPMQPKLPGSLRAQIERKQAAIIPLAEVIECDAAGRFSAAPSWQTFCDSYLSKHLPDRMVPALPDYQFARKGMWTIRFAGKETFLDGTLKGPVFIRYLLVHQGRQIHVARMLADIAGDERLAQASDAGLSISAEDFARLRKRHDELTEDRTEAEEWNDAGRLQAIDEELGQIASYLAPLVGLGGKSRKECDDVGRIRKAIARVIGIALKKVAESDPVLEQHLRNSIKTHTFMAYEPETWIDWNFE